MATGAVLLVLGMDCTMVLSIRYLHRSYSLPKGFKGKVLQMAQQQVILRPIIAVAVRGRHQRP